MRIRLGVPSDANEDEKKAILDAALESVTQADLAQIARGLPTAAEAIARRGIRWKAEPPGDEHFDLAGTVLRRGWGDCDDLAPWHAASLRATGEDPEAQAIVRRSGPNRWHAIVERSDGSIDDPSRAAGMGSVGGDEYIGPFWPAMFGHQFGVAHSPLNYGHAGRVDIPSLSVPAVYSALSRGRSPASAVAGACAGALDVCGDDSSYEHMVRAAMLHDLLRGIPAEELQGEVGFFPALAAALPVASSIAAPLASKALGMMGMGGGGAPSGGGGGGGGGAAPPPIQHIPSPSGGPGVFIVRF